MASAIELNRRIQKKRNEALKREDTNDCPPDDDTLKHTDFQATQKYDNTPNNSTLLNGIAKHDSIESIPNAEDHLLDFNEISAALDSSTVKKEVNTTPPIQINQMGTGIRLRRHNPKTGEFTSRENSSDDDSDDEKEHETVIRLERKTSALNSRYKKKNIEKPQPGCCKSTPKEDLSSSFTPEPMMLTFVGFLRLANFVSAAAVIFGLVTEKLVTMESGDDIVRYEKNISKILGFTELPNDTFHFNVDWRRSVYNLTSYIQFFYVSVVALVLIVDAVGTLTFRWKEYGELTHYQADSTSIVFLFTHSRWLLRIAIGLVLASSISLGFLPVIAHYLKGNPPKFNQGKPVKDDIMFNPYLRDAAFWFVGLSASSLISSVLGMFLNAFPWHGVAWLYDTVMPDQIEDKDDLWVKTWGTPLTQNHHGGKSRKALLQQEENEWVNAHQHASATSVTRMLHLASNILTGAIVVTLYIVSTVLTALIILSTNKEMDKMDFDPRTKEIASLDNFVVFFGSSAILLLNISILFYIMIRVSNLCYRKQTFYIHGTGSTIPFIVKFLAPYSLASSARLLFDVEKIDAEMNYISIQGLEEMKVITCHIWMWLTLVTILIAGFSVFVNFYHKFSSMMKSFYQFICKNICRRLDGDSSGETGVNKALIRFLDTSGTVCALTGLILGISAIFIDQIDFTFEPEGTIKDIINECSKFEEGMREVLNVIEPIIKQLNLDYTCEHVYTAVVAGSGVTLFMSLIPGASSISSLATKGAYYGVRAANSMTNVAKKLEKNKRKIWGIFKVIKGIMTFSFKNMKKIILATDSVSLMQMLPLFPSIYVGFNVFFASFWPKRILFFSSKQRRKTTSDMFWGWALTTLLLIVTIVINTAVLDEIENLIDEQLDGLASVHANRKLGWRIAMAGNGFALIASVIKLISSFILQWQTSKDHENITNAEKDWKMELEKRELLQVLTPHGAKLEKRTQMKYKKERIGPWTWSVPILLTLLACGFGILANFHPKMEMAREPKGSFGKMLDKVYRKIETYESEAYGIQDDTDEECFPPIPTFSDVPSNPLVNPVKKFVEYSIGLVKPIHDVVSGARKQLLLDVDDQLYNTEETNENVWRDNGLQNIGFVLMIPRALCFFILIFGMMASSIFVCQMQIIECIEPRKLVNAYRNVAIFSIIYVVGAQLSLFNMVSSFGIPFYKIYIRFGLGFVYDVVADSILLATYIGMQNEFFFAIPKRKTTVTYSVPGVSAEGPNLPGMII